MASKDPGYAFESSGSPIRRYFDSTTGLPENSTMDMLLPYLNATIRWIDASSDNRSVHANDVHFIDINTNTSTIRLNGSVALIREKPWSVDDATPRQPRKIDEKWLVSVRVGRIDSNIMLSNGSLSNPDTQCRITDLSADWGPIPAVEQHLIQYNLGDSWAANDCFLIGEATVTAGVIRATNCKVQRSGGMYYAATCAQAAADATAEADWASGLAVDFLSETLKYTRMLDVTQPWMRNGLDGYTTGMLQLGYQAAWSALTHRLHNANESVIYYPAEPVVYAEVSRRLLFAWLGMSATLTVAALLVAVAQRASRVRTIRDPTLAAVLLDLTPITHSERARGLCGAVTLSDEDKDLPPMRWAESVGDVVAVPGGQCRSRVVFANGDSDP